MKKGIKSDCCVEVARRIAKERIKTKSGVVEASGEVEERIITLRGVGARIATVGGRTDGSRHWRQRKPADCDENKHARKVN